MIIMDLSNLVFSQVLDFERTTKMQPDMQVIRNLVIDRMRTHKEKLREFADEIVIAVDSRYYQRKRVFKYYKAKRAAGREASTFDWDAFFPMFDAFKQELRDYFPVKMIEVEGAEADDIMGVLGMRYGPHKKVCIVTSDHDMIQVQQICPQVKQWSAFHGKFLTPKNAEYDLFTHIVKGDGGDGIPNILSPDDVLVTPGARQKSVMTKKMVEQAKFGVEQPDQFCDTEIMLERFNRNRTLVDLRMIPEEIQSSIVEAYEESKPNVGKMYDYLMANRLTKILKEGGF